jgi:hypothetical protein
MNIDFFKRLFTKRHEKINQVDKTVPKKNDEKDEFKTYNSTITIQTKK